MSKANMKLATKMYLGFGSIIAIVLLLGGIAIFNMLSIQKNAIKLSDDYAPEVEIANKMERHALLTMYNVRGYNYTEDESYLKSGMDYLNATLADIKEASELAKRSTVLTMLADQAKEAETATTTYKSLLEESVKIINEVKEIRANLATIAADYQQNAEAFLESQNDAMLREINSGARAEALKERLEKITDVNEIIDLGNWVRIANFRGQALGDVKIIEGALPNFRKIQDAVERVRKTTRQEANLRQLATIENRGNGYRTNLETLIKDLRELADLNSRRVDVATNVLKAAETVALAGIKNTTSIAHETTSTVNASVIILVIGLIIAVFISGCLAYFITKGIAKALTTTINNLTSSATQIGSASYQLSTASQQLSSMATEQASSIEETSSSLEEMSGMVENNVSSADNALKLSNQVKEKSEKGNTSMSQLQEAMREILNSNEKIKALVKVIGNIGEKTQIMDEIVFQTKLLSFNASVEAERAGEHGRGFAVVAQEVGNLAQMSGKAAQEIASIVKDSIKEADQITTENKAKVEHGNRFVEEAAKILQEIMENAGTVAQGASEVLEASKDQSSGIKQINKAMTQLDKATQENASTAEETASSAEELSSQVDALTNVVRDLNLLVEGTVKDIEQVRHSSQQKNTKPGSSGKVVSLKPKATRAEQASSEEKPAAAANDNSWEAL